MMVKYLGIFLLMVVISFVMAAPAAEDPVSPLEEDRASIPDDVEDAQPEPTRKIKRGIYGGYGYGGYGRGGYGYYPYFGFGHGYGGYYGGYYPYYGIGYGYGHGYGLGYGYYW
ncbi:RNA-binding protein squid-like [Anthonomus grandis grandis]|uniref:RNA-binding protein squid-like n=1 Tax=Anthonomus grandis grandis TaxID=2921223 RepID=UPI00216614F1|nr:RNA-binding protein squid-like [Anthonomus grandis grandis]